MLARKYRPQGFEDLIGQAPMVRTLRNAFASGRIAQAYMLTGVRGVGKTTTARILARALNYEGTDGTAGPTLDMQAEGVHCRAILESRHVDVIEMDAASHTGIDDIREIIEAVRYRPAQARYKIYIIDEVHMLSKAAFNGLLKTLEEPPEHVKFVFATTEIRKVPITILSRCQRFDLRRVEAGELVRHLGKIATAESVSVTDEALALIARASEGSVRDALSLFDQAIAHGAGEVHTDELRSMLGVADRSRVVDLFEKAMSADVAGALREFAEQYREGAAPEAVLTDLASFSHLVTRLKLVPEAAEDGALSPTEIERGKAFAERLSVPELTRAWQILLKGISETESSSRPEAAAEMVLIRLAHASSLPSPDEVIRKLQEEGASAGGGAPQRPVPGGGGGARAALAAVPQAAPPRPVPQVPQAVAAPAPRAEARAEPEPRPAAEPAPEPMPGPETFEEVVALAQEKRDISLKVALECHVHIVKFEPGRIEMNLGPNGSHALPHELGRKLAEWTGRRWVVTLTREKGGPTLREKAEAEKRSFRDEMARHPSVSAVLERFPGARIVDIRVSEEEPPAEIMAGLEALPPGDEEDET
ncbi:DNA polymerase IIIprotein gamma and tau [Lutibaculum baratangense AMV1]|uniref:DNA polymerase III subunit gamma/tau n=1 Tax=Lutibaculum baratangense AMV1 TaxID=631454 RepID=V4RLV7_9HYPH|nr:DNA polymerase IIIprotein gamma and tau [Lutibaculum baratangense AMV1]